MTILEEIFCPFNAYKVLNCLEEDSDQNLFNAYCKAKQQHKPYAEEAYQRLATPYLKSRYKFLQINLIKKPEELKNYQSPVLNYVGPALWQKALNEQDREKG